MNPLLQAMKAPNNLVNILKNGNPDKIASDMMKNNPEFKNFVEKNRGKRPEDIAKEHGIDLSSLDKMFS